MNAKRLIVVVAGIGALATAFYVGLQSQSDERGSLSGIVEAAQDRMGPQFARPIELDIWSRHRLPSDPEPVIAPSQIAEVIGACVGAAEKIPACAESRRILVKSFQEAMRDPDATRLTAACLTEGCDGLSPIAPANACLFWTLYINSQPDRVQSVDRTLRQRTCEAARFGDEKRRDGLLRLWNRAAKDG